jgi:hypothetical protein
VRPVPLTRPPTIKERSVRSPATVTRKGLPALCGALPIERIAFRHPGGRPLHCRISMRLMSQMGHFRPTHSALVPAECPLYVRQRPPVIEMRDGVKGHKATLAQLTALTEPPLSWACLWIIRGVWIRGLGR